MLQLAVVAAVEMCWLLTVSDLAAFAAAFGLSKVYLHS